MTHTYTLTGTATILAMFVAICMTNVQIASAQERFPVPQSEKPIPFQSFQSAPKEVRATTQEKRSIFENRVVETRNEIRSTVKENSNVRAADIKAELDAATTREEHESILKEDHLERNTMRDNALQKRDEFRERAENLRKEIEGQRGEIRAEIKSEAGNRIKSQLENILERLSGTLDSFTNILERIHNKLAELEADGVDTTDAMNAAETAEQVIIVASDAVADARIIFTEALESDTPREYLDTMKESVRTATESVKEAHTALKTATGAIKDITQPVGDSN